MGGAAGGPPLGPGGIGFAAKSDSCLVSGAAEEGSCEIRGLSCMYEGLSKSPEEQAANARALRMRAAAVVQLTRALVIVLREATLLSVSGAG